MNSTVPIVLGIVGSPRRGGNTDVLVQEALRGAKGAGGETECLFLPELTIHPCLGCEHCIETGVCTHDDDMKLVIEKLQRANIWLFGSPVYFFGPTAQFKAFLDRWVGVPIDAFLRKSASYIVPLGASSSDVAASTVNIFERSMRFRGLRNLGGLVAPDLMNMGAAGKSDEYLKQAHFLGAELLRLHAEAARAT